jgi:hypothetical protein
MNDTQPPTDRRGDGLFASAVGVVAAVGLFLRYAFEFQINTDATAYVSIARQCPSGQRTDGSRSGRWSGCECSMIERQAYGVRSGVLLSSEQQLLMK